mgnify:CR=1 FL=1
MQEKAIVSVRIFPRKQSYDIEIPLDISANDLVLALNQLYFVEINCCGIMGFAMAASLTLQSEEGENTKWNSDIS